MAFRPGVADSLREMDPRLFLDQPMGLREDITRRARRPVPERLGASLSGARTGTGTGTGTEESTR